MREVSEWVKTQGQGRGFGQLQWLCLNLMSSAVSGCRWSGGQEEGLEGKGYVLCRLRLWKKVWKWVEWAASVSWGGHESLPRLGYTAVSPYVTKNSSKYLGLFLALFAREAEIYSCSAFNVSGNLCLCVLYIFFFKSHQRRLGRDVSWVRFMIFLSPVTFDNESCALILPALVIWYTIVICQWSNY